MKLFYKKHVKEFKIIKEKYNDNINEPGLVGINPAMLIQVDNDSSDKEKSLIFDQNIDLIIKTLEKNNLSWVKYFDQNNKDSNLRHKANYSLRDISKDSSPVDVIIFKVGPATGWNIPRAYVSAIKTYLIKQFKYSNNWKNQKKPISWVWFP
ncbi:hypothetical protein OM999_02815 [Mycoplasmopsis cynos]|nr:hypothetical protein OM999_02815 [Mycoplasmopsis cynos]